MIFFTLYVLFTWTRYAAKLIFSVATGVFKFHLNLAGLLTFRHRASCFIGQAFRYSPENAFYVFNQQIYFIIW